MKSTAWLRSLGCIVLAAWALGLGTSPSAAAPAAAADPITLTAAAGLDGLWKENCWLPLRVTVANDGPAVQGQLEAAPAGGLTPSAFIVTRPVDLPTHSRREVVLYLAPASGATAIQVRLVAGGRDAAPPITVPVRPVTSLDLIYGVLAGSPTTYNVLADVDPAGGQAHLAQLELSALPPQPQGWQSLDVLVVSDADTGALSLEQRSALGTWLDGGGRLFVMGGPSWQTAAAGLQPWLAAQPAGTRTLDGLPGLAAFAGAGPIPPGEVLVAQGRLAADARVLVGTRADWLVAERRQGFGQVVYFAFDPAFAPLRAWDGLGALMRQVLAEDRGRPAWAAGLTNAPLAQNAADAMPDRELPSPWLVCGFLGLYLALVGPLNYWALTRLRRRELAWLTIPAIVLAFSLTAYLTGYGLAGAQPTVHQLSILQVAPGAARARLDQVVGLYSPRRATYDLEFDPGVLARPMVQGDPVPGGLRVEQGDPQRLIGLRAEIASVQTFMAQGWVPAPDVEGRLQLALAAGSPRLAGSVVNRSDLALRDVVLLAPGAVLRLGDLLPAAELPVSLVLGSGRATAALQQAVLPLAPKAGPTVPYLGGSYDSTLDDILGNGDYYASRDTYRRYALLAAALTTSTGASAGRGNGFFLAGWAAAPPAAIRVLDTAFKTEAETLYLAELPVSLTAPQGTLTLPAALMSWSVLEPAVGGAASPYDATLYPGDALALRFQPAVPMPSGRVTELRLSLSGSSPDAPPQVDLWDFGRSEWTSPGAITLGNQAVPAPGRFVGPGGELRARLSNPGPAAAALGGLEFTLRVEP